MEGYSNQQEEGNEAILNILNQIQVGKLIRYKGRSCRVTQIPDGKNIKTFVLEHSTGIRTSKHTYEWGTALLTEKIESGAAVIITEELEKKEAVEKIVEEQIRIGGTFRYEGIEYTMDKIPDTNDREGKYELKMAIKGVLTPPRISFTLKELTEGLMSGKIQFVQPPKETRVIIE